MLVLSLDVADRPPKQQTKIVQAVKKLIAVDNTAVAAAAKALLLKWKKIMLPGGSGASTPQRMGFLFRCIFCCIRFSNRSEQQQRRRLQRRPVRQGHQ